MSRARPALRGFTLIEVLIALLVVALGMGALLSTIASSAETVARLRDKSFAQWIALNQIAKLRLSGQQPQVGITTGDEEYAGAQWRWEQEIQDPGIAGILRVEVRVGLRPPGFKKSDGQSQDTEFQPVSTGFGFLGSSVTRASGLDPDWSLASAVQRNPGTGGGGPQTGGGPQPAGGGPQPPVQR
jgi:general secretion pathway protein I